MRRRRPQGEEAKPSLFPFLDVMLCTIGTLIVLLLVIVFHAWKHAETTVEAAPEPTHAAKEDDPATWRNRVAQLRSTQTEVTSAIKDRRVQLGYLEKHTRDLETKIIELQAMLAERERLSGENDEQVAKTESEIARLKRQVTESKQNLDELKRENAERPATYSIIPYEGPNRTPRRPIYIECRADQVIIQPEGIILTPQDFLISDDPGNPLSTALRATREYIAGGKSLREEEEPYPLVIVRPDGVEAYYAVRQALQGWTTEFGYEMVEQNWKLKFPPADPNLAVTQNRALAESRLRQKGLIALLERKSRKGRTYRPAATGGIVAEGVDTGYGAQMIPYHGERGEEEEGGPFSGFAGGKGNGGDTGGLNGNGGANGSGGGKDGADGAGTGGGRNGDHINGQFALNGDGKVNGNLNASINGQGGRGSGNGANGQSGKNGDEAGDGINDSMTNADATRRGTFGGQYAQGSATPGGATGANRGAAGGERRIGEYGSTSNNASSTASRGDASGASGGPGGSSGSPGGASGSAGSSGGSSAGSPDASSGMSSATLADESLAKRRGRDWGLRYAEPTATPVQRPLRIVCDADRIIVTTDDAKRAPQQIVLKPRTGESVDEVVTAVWAEIKRWGIAGKGMYWRPILSFDVRSGGEARYEEFRRLLDGSGLEVRRRGENVARQTSTAPSAIR